MKLFLPIALVALATPAIAQPLAFTFPNGVKLQGQPTPAPFFGFSVKPVVPLPPPPVIKPPLVVSPPVPPVVVVTPPTVVKPPIVPLVPTPPKPVTDLDKDRHEHREHHEGNGDGGQDKDKGKEMHYGFQDGHFWGYQK